MPGFFSTLRRMTLTRGRESNKIGPWVEPLSLQLATLKLADRNQDVTVCLAVNTDAKGRLSEDSPDVDKLDFMLLHWVVAEYMSIRLRAATDELVFSKKKIKLLLSKV